MPQFRDALRAALIRISENPKQFPPAIKSTRRALLRRFPYILVFREMDDAVYIVALDGGGAVRSRIFGVPSLAPGARVSLEFRGAPTVAYPAAAAEGAAVPAGG